MNRIHEQIGDRVCFFKSPGIATIIMHQEKASTMFQLIDTNENDDDMDIKKIATKRERDERRTNHKE